MNVTLIDDKSSSENQSKTSISKDSWKYMAFTSTLKSEREKDDEEFKNLEWIYSS